MCYQVDSYGLVIGLVNTPLGENAESLFNTEFKDSVFDEYKKGVNKNSRNQSAGLNEYIYCPAGYYLFGDCNMAVLSLIDDFAFPNRVFHAGHGYNTNDKKYTLQVITGISVLDNEQADSGKTLLEQAKATFLTKTYPFIGITNYKINNGLLIGNGLELLELIKRAIRKLKNTPEYRSDIELICIDCFSNHELTVVYFSKSLSQISTFINATRTLRLDGLGEKVDTIARNSLLWEYLKKENEAERGKDEAELLKDIKESHLFSTTYSYLGYAMDIALPDVELIFQYHWDLKPGHCSVFKNKVVDLLGKENIRLQITPGTDMLVVEQTKNINLHIKEIEKIEQEHTRDMRKQRVCVVFENLGLAGGYDELRETHPQLMSRLEQCAFNKLELQSLRTALDRNRVSKVLKERTLKMYETFNDCITDPLFFNYFIELKGNLKGIREEIIKYEANTETLEEFHLWLDGRISNFEKAYYNRFHQSSRMKNISDFNLEYNGGIQQLISAYDVGYKSVSQAFTKRYQENFVFVSGYERVSSDRNSLLINIFHITYPELYAATIWKEAANFYWEVMERKRDDTSPKNLWFNDSLMKEESALVVLRARISYSSGFDSSSYAHTLMLSCLNQDFIHDLLADILVFSYGYLSDFDLFSHYYWIYFAQMSHFYNRDGCVSPAVFTKFLTRWEFVRRFFKEEQNDFYEQLDPKFRELYFAHSMDVASYVAILLKELKKFDFLHYIRGIVLSFLNKEDCISGNRYFLDAVIDKTNQKEKQEEDDEEEHYKQVVNEYHRKMKEKAEDDKNLFLQGKIVSFDQDERQLLFIRRLFYSYLKAMKFLSISDDYYVKVLERDNEGNVICRENEYENILADPLGGMFMYDEKVRATYFKCRSVFYKTLWGMGLKIKKDYVDSLSK